MEDFAVFLGGAMPDMSGWDAIHWDDRGLITAVVQDEATGDVLMVAWMNAEALRLTLETGETHFWSRHREELWHKGATSGNTQRVSGIWIDCDGDTLLVKVVPAGPACHTGAATCFFQPLAGVFPQPSPARNARTLERLNVRAQVLAHLWEVIEERKQSMPPGSYTASLFAAGLPRLAQKVGEEAVETAVAALSESPERTVYEMADLFYHCLVLLAAKGLTLKELEAELARRFK